MRQLLEQAPKWKSLRPHDLQRQFYLSTKRFNIVPAGRRGGKTEILKRRGVKKAIGHCKDEEGYYVFGAPTYKQVKKIFWKDICGLVPKDLVVEKRTGDLELHLYNGAIIALVGMDKPERAEGVPLDWLGLDEYGNMKAEVWSQHLRPALSDRMGEADFTGVPEGRNHYYDLWLEALNDDDWGRFTWKSSDILPASEIEAAKRHLDLLSFQQEYEASFVTFQGRIYYTFVIDDHVKDVTYDPSLPLIFCFDFNVSPGTCSVVQHQTLSHYIRAGGEAGRCSAGGFTAVLDEVRIEQGGYTPIVCRALKKKWSHHTGLVYIYGDATGGAEKSSGMAGNDWDQVKDELKGFQPKFRVGKSNPSERNRVNCMNSRVETAGGVRSMLFHPQCKYMIRDMEGVRASKSGDGSIDKKADKMLTHLSDGLGYYITEKFPIHKRQETLILEAA